MPRDIDKFPGWTATLVPPSQSICDHIHFDPSIQRIEVLTTQQFDMTGKKVTKRAPIRIDKTDNGATLVASFPEIQVLYKLVNIADDG